MEDRNWKDWKDETHCPKSDGGEKPGQPCALNCRVAKGLKCVCSCHGLNHGALFKANNRRMDEFAEEKETLLEWHQKHRLSPAQFREVINMGEVINMDYLHKNGRF